MQPHFKAAVALLLPFLLSACATRTSAPQPSAITIFDGKDTSAFVMKDGSPCTWPVQDGVMVATDADAFTKAQYLDCTIKLEFWLPQLPPTLQRGKRANSGVYLQGLYEIQILDSHGLTPVTFQDCGAIYHQRPPDTQEFPPAETWQTMEITYKAPKLDPAGHKTANARCTVVLNRKTVQLDQEILGPTAPDKGGVESPNPASIILQYHTGHVKFRNIRITPQ